MRCVVPKLSVLKAERRKPNALALRALVVTSVFALLACDVPPEESRAPGTSEDSGVVDGGVPDAGTSYVPPVIKRERSLFWTQPELLDDAGVVSFGGVMATISPDNHGGRLLNAWFRRFGTTPHSERYQPAQLMDEVAAAQGSDPAAWNLNALPFTVTGVHNRIDLANLKPGGHCGELRVSFSSTHPTIQPLHILFLFQQPPAPGDTVNGRVTCEATAQKWAELSRLEGAVLYSAARAEISSRLTAQSFLMAETVELTVSPWEWRQWTKVPDTSGTLPFVFDNPPLFQTVDVEGLNQAGALRDDFLAFVTANAAALDARTLLIPERFRKPSSRVVQGVPRTPLSLNGISQTVTETFPNIRKNIELVGCPVCHTADAEFVQTRTDRSVSPFYETELGAREVHLGRLARGEAVVAKFGPLQPAPKLPP